MVYEKKVSRNNKRARKKGKIGNLTTEGYIKNVEFYEGKCCYCDEDGTSLEHLNPLFLKGGTTQDNCVPCCIPCNSDKGCEDLLDYIDRVDMEEWRIACIEAIQNTKNPNFTVEITASEFQKYYEEEMI